MQRRTFFKWLGSSVAPLIAPHWAFSQTNPFTAQDAATLRALAAVVLPASLGRDGVEAVADQFAGWLRSYTPGAEVSPGYGFPHVQKLPPNPSAHYAEQLRGLETAARATGASFAKLDVAARRTIVEAALEAAQVDRIPERPDGRHIVSDLMSFFFNGSQGEDYLYGATIRRDACRGLASSGERPARVG